VPTIVNIHQAKTHLSRLLVDVGRGEDVIIAKNGQPLARLTSILAPKSRTPGRFRGQIKGSSTLLGPAEDAESSAWVEGPASDPLRRSSAP